MNTLRKQKLDKLLKMRSERLRLATKKRLPRWKALLIGLLMTLSVAISGCQSASNVQVPPQGIHVDASLMVEPNLTSEMLSVLSE